MMQSTSNIGLGIFLFALFWNEDLQWDSLLIGHYFSNFNLPSVPFCPLFFSDFLQRGHCKTKQKTKICGFYKKISWFFKIFKNRILIEASF